MLLTPSCVTLLLVTFTSFLHVAVSHRNVEGFDFAADVNSVVGKIHRNFSCEGRDYGYYADQAQDCKVFHICSPVTATTGRKLKTFMFSFFCPLNTRFSQDTKTCIGEENSFSCERAHTLYDLNKAIGHKTKKKPVSRQRPRQESPVVSSKPDTFTNHRFSAISSSRSPVEPKSSSKVTNLGNNGRTPNSFNSVIQPQQSPRFVAPQTLTETEPIVNDLKPNKPFSSLHHDGNIASNVNDLRSSSRNQIKANVAKEVLNKPPQVVEQVVLPQRNPASFTNDNAVTLERQGRKDQSVHSVHFGPQEAFQDSRNSFIHEERKDISEQDVKSNEEPAIGRKDLSHKKHEIHKNVKEPKKSIQHVKNKSPAKIPFTSFTPIEDLGPPEVLRPPPSLSTQKIHPPKSEDSLSRNSVRTDEAFTSNGIGRIETLITSNLGPSFTVEKDNKVPISHSVHRTEFLKGHHEDRSHFHNPVIVNTPSAPPRNPKPSFRVEAPKPFTSENIHTTQPEKINLKNELKEEDKNSRIQTASQVDPPRPRTPVKTRLHSTRKFISLKENEANAFIGSRNENGSNRKSTATIRARNNLRSRNNDHKAVTALKSDAQFVTSSPRTFVIPTTTPVNDDRGDVSFTPSPYEDSRANILRRRGSRRFSPNQNQQSVNRQRKTKQKVNIVEARTETSKQADDLRVKHQLKNFNARDGSISSQRNDIINEQRNINSRINTNSPISSIRKQSFNPKSKNNGLDSLILPNIPKERPHDRSSTAQNADERGSSIKHSSKTQHFSSAKEDVDIKGDFVDPRKSNFENSNVNFQTSPKINHKLNTDANKPLSSKQDTTQKDRSRASQSNQRSPIEKKKSAQPVPPNTKNNVQSNGKPLIQIPESQLSQYPKEYHEYIKGQIAKFASSKLGNENTKLKINLKETKRREDAQHSQTEGSPKVDPSAGHAQINIKHKDSKHNSNIYKDIRIVYEDYDDDSLDNLAPLIQNDRRTQFTNARRVTSIKNDRRNKVINRGRVTSVRTDHRKQAIKGEREVITVRNRSPKVQSRDRNGNILSHAKPSVYNPNDRSHRINKNTAFLSSKRPVQIFVRDDDDNDDDSKEDSDERTEQIVINRNSNSFSRGGPRISQNIGSTRTQSRNPPQQTKHKQKESKKPIEVFQSNSDGAIIQIQDGQLNQYPKEYHEYIKQQLSQFAKTSLSGVKQVKIQSGKPAPTSKPPTKKPSKVNTNNRKAKEEKVSPKVFTGGFDDVILQIPDAHISQYPKEYQQQIKKQNNNQNASPRSRVVEPKRSRVSQGVKKSDRNQPPEDLVSFLPKREPVRQRGSISRPPSRKVIRNRVELKSETPVVRKTVKKVIKQGTTKRVTQRGERTRTPINQRNNQIKNVKTPQNTKVFEGNSDGATLKISEDQLSQYPKEYHEYIRQQLSGFAQDNLPSEGKFKVDISSDKKNKIQTNVANNRRGRIIEKKPQEVERKKNINTEIQSKNIERSQKVQTAHRHNKNIGQKTVESTIKNVLKSSNDPNDENEHDAVEIRKIPHRIKTIFDQNRPQQGRRRTVKKIVKISEKGVRGSSAELDDIIRVSHGQDLHNDVRGDFGTRARTTNRRTSNEHKTSGRTQVTRNDPSEDQNKITGSRRRVGRKKILKKVVPLEVQTTTNQKDGNKKLSVIGTSVGRTVTKKRGDSKHSTIIQNFEPLTELELNALRTLTQVNHRRTRGTDFNAPNLIKIIRKRKRLLSPEEINRIASKH